MGVHLERRMGTGGNGLTGVVLVCSPWGARQKIGGGGMQRKATAVSGRAQLTQHSLSIAFQLRSLTTAGGGGAQTQLSWLNCEGDGAELGRTAVCALYHEDPNSSPVNRCALQIPKPGASV